MGENNSSGISILATATMTRHTVRAQIADAPDHRKKYSESVTLRPDLVTIEYQHGGYPIGEWAAKKVVISGQRVLARGNVSSVSRAEEVFYNLDSVPEWVGHLIKACTPIGEVK